MPSQQNFQPGPQVSQDLFANRQVNDNKRKRLSESDVPVKRRRDDMDEPYRGSAGPRAHVWPQKKYGSHGGLRK